MSEHVWELTAREMIHHVAEGHLSAREVLQAHWDRIDEVNPLINAVVYEDRENAWAHAQAADARQAAGEPLGRLHGLPLSNKDTNDTMGMPSTWGSPLLQNVIATQDSVIVARLRESGAILTGKNNVPEFAAGGHSFNSVYGVTKNPYDLGRSAGGSSGGAAAAIAAGIQPVGDGSDMGGSLRIPASFCSIVGLRPSLGLIPSPGPNSWAWLGRTGPMAKDVRDLALMMEVMSGSDPRVQLSEHLNIPKNFLEVVDQGIDDVKIGYGPDLGLGLPVDPEVHLVVESLVGVLQRVGAHIENASPNLEEADFVFEQTRAFDFEMAWGDLVRGAPDQVKPEMLQNVELGRRQTAEILRELALARTRLEGETRQFFDRYDLWLTPTTQLPPFPVDLRYPDQIADVHLPGYLDWMRSVCVVSAMGNPAISIPAGFTSTGLPVGIQVVAPHGQDALLIRFARVIEQLQPWASHTPTFQKLGEK